MEYLSKNEQETKEIAFTFSKNLKSGDIICLYGDLGAGKTAFVKFLAQALGVVENITSPTFTLLNIYHTTNNPSIKHLVHVDTYRLKNNHELVEIGIEDYLGQPTTICCIEWPEKIEEMLTDKKVIKIFIAHAEDDYRLITIE